jgi:hypothetical protein
MLLNGINHVAILTGDTERLLERYHTPITPPATRGGSS